MFKRRVLLRRMLLLPVLAIPLIASDCLVPPQDYAAANQGWDVPDPAMVTEAFSPAYWTQVYGSSSCGDVACAYGITTIDIPSYSISYPPSGHSPQSVTDALDGWHPTSDYKYTWAPSVLYVDGEYLMIFASVFGSKGSCLYTATSAVGFTFSNETQLACPPPSESTTHNFVDPSIFIDSDHTIYVAYSDETRQANCHGSNNAKGTGSTIMIQKLSSNGLSRVGNPVTLLTWGEATEIGELSVSSLGSNPCLENPQIDLDNGGYYDLEFSIGEWESNATYDEGEVACVGLNNTTSGCGYDPTGGDVISTGDGAGASTLTTGYPSSNYMIEAGWNSAGTIRQDFVGSTSYCDPTVDC